MPDLSGSPLVPVNLATYIRGILGGRAPQAGDFSDSDRQAILGAVRRALAEGGGRSGVIGYGDYGAEEGRFSDWTGRDVGASLGEILLRSFDDPVFRMETTLGMANYDVLPDGRVIVRDRYDFNAPPEMVDRAIAEKGRAGTLISQILARPPGVQGLLNLIGNLFIAPEGRGRDYEIEVGRLSR